VLLPACRELIELAWAHGQGKGDRLLRAWGKNWRDLQTACDRASIEACSAHDLRRTFAHWHLEAGLSYDDVARALGHKDTAMLHRVYGKLPAPALRDRMAQALNSAQLVPSKGRAKGRKVQIKQSPDPRVSATNQGFSEYRRSELNQRPWDYDSPALTD
jgi:Phage integrase family